MLYEQFIVPAPQNHLRKRNIFVQVAAGAVIWSLLPLAILNHIHVFLYQFLYFSIFDIPKLKFRDFFSLDRWELKRLNFRQKISCAYCAYGNAVSSWVKAVMNQTETYSCAIKHSTERKGLEYQKDFLPYDKFR